MEDNERIHYVTFSQNVKIGDETQRVFVCMDTMDHHSFGIGISKDDAWMIMTKKRKERAAWRRKTDALEQEIKY